MGAVPLVMGHGAGKESREALGVVMWAASRCPPS